MFYRYVSKNGEIARLVANSPKGLPIGAVEISVEEWAVEEKRAQLKAEIKNRTKELLEEGFVYNNEEFPLDGFGRIQLVQLYTGCHTGTRELPIEVMTKSKAVYIATTEDDLLALCFKGIKHASKITAEGSNLLARAARAMDEEELGEIEDNR